MERKQGVISCNAWIARFMMRICLHLVNLNHNDSCDLLVWPSNRHIPVQLIYLFFTTHDNETAGQPFNLFLL